MPDTLDFLHTSGGLIAPSILADAILDTPRDKAFAPSAFVFNGNAPEAPKAHAETVETAFEIACAQYDEVSRKFDTMDLPDLRRRWLVPLMEILDFAPAYQRGHLASRDGRQNFAISHLGWDTPGAPPIITTNSSST
jgi:hypothetical protein